MTANVLTDSPKRLPLVSPYPLLSGNFDVSGAASARMQFELARAVAAAASGPALLTPSFSLAATLTPSHRIDLTAACSRSTTPGLHSNFGSCESLCGLADLHAMRACAPSAATSLAVPRPHPMGLHPGILPSSMHGLTSSSLGEQVEELLKSGLKRQRAANLSAAAAAAVRTADQPPASPSALSIPTPLPPALQPSKRPAGSDEMPHSLGASPLIQPYSPALLNARLLADPSPLPPGCLQPIALAPEQRYGRASPPDTTAVGAAAPAAAYDAPGASSPQPVTLLPCGSAVLPRIANLKSGCSDGLMLLSCVSCLVARDGTSPLTGRPSAKRPRS